MQSQAEIFSLLQLNTFLHLGQYCSFPLIVYFLKFDDLKMKPSTKGIYTFSNFQINY